MPTFLPSFEGRAGRSSGIDRPTMKSHLPGAKRRLARIRPPEKKTNRKKRTERCFSEKFACPVSGFTIPEIEPRLFSFNNPYGACPACGGLGVEQHVDADL